MYIKSMVLDGFKSYGHRVEVCDLDKEFNAITGLNGTGKSNILDAICFVLGITNLSHVRATNLQDLVYKSGQAGITRASVSITFDNSDRSQCPIGYENQKEITITRQVVMGGKNKYMFNGIAVQQKRAHDFFNTIQLNVNNPHFLIMQGRITKVLNMKPQEILAMIEEAAGTRMYENKKQVAQKTIEKKDSKLQELNVIIREDIAPKLQKLQDERTQYQEYQKVVRELENLTKIHVAWRYVKGQAKSEEMTKKVQAVKVDIEQHKATIEGNKKKVVEIEAEITERHSRMESEDGTELRQLEAELVEKEEAEGVANNAHQMATEALQEHKRQEKHIERSLADDQKALGNNKKTLDGANNTFDSLREASERSAAELADVEARFVAISSGLEADTTSTASLQDQLMAAKREALEAETRITQAVMEKKHDDDCLLKLQRDFKSTSSQFQKDQEHIQQKEREVKKLQIDLENLQQSAGRNQELKSRLHTLQNENRQKCYALEKVQRQYPRYNFEYKDPTPNFDRSKVFGTVAQLVSVDDPTFYKALETVAGGRLYNVVIDDDRTGKLVLERGELKNRTTFIPLNRIQPHVLDNRVLENARRVVGADKVWSALSLISYEQSVSRAVQFVFGSVLICSDIGVARTVAYHPSVKARCVTLDGDVADPRGGMSGGAMEREPPKAFEDFKTLRALEVELSRNQAELDQIDQEARRTNQSSESYNAARQRFELVSHELSVVKSRMENTSHHQMNEEIKNLKKRVEELSAQIEEDKAKQKEANKLARELEVKMGDLKGHREREFKKAEENLQKAKVEAEKSNKLWRQREQEFNTLNLGVSELEKAVANGEKQLAEARATSTKLAQAVDTCEEALKEAKKNLKETQKMIKDKKDEIGKKNKDISRIIRDKEKLLSANNDAKLKIKELEFQLESLNKEAQDCLNQIQHLANDNPWVESEKQYFGVSGGLYDFAVRDPVVAGQRLAQVRERKDKLSRGINARAHTLLSKEEEQYAELLNKKKIVEEDRKKLVQVIAELDEKKKRALQNAVRQVNLDFGSIFSTLLPGAQAKLQHAEGMTMIEGLEFKVGFNNTWKDSLGELSGGQRSLVALSLILAMLLFKPAPVYILDEVDAALDLSHTQNIGTMLKHHFRRSQFIVVSLKDGMFNNANVLYRTRFVDGMSTVSRTVNTDNRDRRDQQNGH